MYEVEVKVHMTCVKGMMISKYIFELIYIIQIQYWSKRVKYIYIYIPILHTEAHVHAGPEIN